MARRSGSGSGGLFIILAIAASIIGLITEYWYVLLIIAGVALVIGIIVLIVSSASNHAEEKERQRIERENELKRKRAYISSPEPKAPQKRIEKRSYKNKLEEVINQQIIAIVNNQNEKVLKESHLKWLETKRSYQIELGCEESELVSIEEISAAKEALRTHKSIQKVNIPYAPGKEEEKLQAVFAKASVICSSNNSEVSAIFGNCKSIKLSDDVFLIFTIWYPIIFYSSRSYAIVEKYDNLKVVKDYELERMDGYVSRLSYEVESTHYLYERKDGRPDRRYSDNPSYSYVYKRFLSVTYSIHTFKKDFPDKKSIDEYFVNYTEYLDLLNTPRCKKIVSYMLNADGNLQYSGVKKIISDENKMAREKDRKEKLERQRLAAEEAQRLAEEKAKRDAEIARQKEEERKRREEEKKLREEERKRKLKEQRKAERLAKQQRLKRIEEAKQAHLEAINAQRKTEDSKYLPFEITESIKNTVSLVDFNEAQEYAYSTVISYEYKSTIYPHCASWKDFYASFVTLLAQDYPGVFEKLVGQSIIGARKADIVYSRRVSTLRSPAKLSDNLYIETALSAKDTVLRTGILLKKCRIRVENVFIFFTKKDSEKELFEERKRSYSGSRSANKTPIQTDPYAGLSAEERQLLIQFRKDKEAAEKTAEEEALKAKTQASLVEATDSPIVHVGNNKTITNNIFSFNYRQIETKKRKYLLYFIDDLGKKISAEKVIESHKIDEEFKISFQLLSAESFDKNKNYYLLICDNDSQEIIGKIEYSINIAFVSDFDF